VIAARTVTRWQRLRWPLILAGLLLVQAGGVIAMVVVSGRDPSFAIEPNYYEKALAWDETSRQRAASESLGWSAHIALDHSPAGPVLTIELQDRLGRPLDGAAVDAEVYHHARSADRQTLRLVANGDGRYAAAAAMTRPGQWEVRISAVRGPETWSSSRQMSVEGAVR
jgi:nitrogen fixation protein FixH